LQEKWSFGLARSIEKKKSFGNERKM